MPFSDAKYPPLARRCFAVTAWFCVNARSYEEAKRLLEDRLPNPESDGHAVIDSWHVEPAGDEEF
jgi:hypothetical protein